MSAHAPDLLPLPSYDHGPTDSPETPCARCAELQAAHGLLDTVEWFTDKTTARVTHAGRSWDLTADRNREAGDLRIAWTVRGPGYAAWGVASHFSAARTEALVALVRLASLPPIARVL